jgi:hypothetical protein
MLLKFNTSDEIDKEIELLKNHYEVNTASKAAQHAILNHPAALDEIERHKRRIGELEGELRKIKRLLRNKAELENELSFYANQRDLEL